MKTLGTSMLASAGVLGIVAGIAAQSTLGNLFAGLSIAFGDMVRIGDEVVVDGEMGTVDEITVSYLVLRTWDERRITMPVSYFTSKPFENWSRGGPQLTGTVFLQLDHSAPIAELRARTEELVRANDDWDGRSLEPRRHRQHAHHDRGARRGLGTHLGRSVDAALRSPRAAARLAPAASTPRRCRACASPAGRASGSAPPTAAGESDLS